MVEVADEDPRIVRADIGVGPDIVDDAESDLLPVAVNQITHHECVAGNHPEAALEIHDPFAVNGVVMLGADAEFFPAGENIEELEIAFRQAVVQREFDCVRMRVVEESDPGIPVVLIGFGPVVQPVVGPEQENAQTGQTVQRERDLSHARRIGPERDLPLQQVFAEEVADPDRRLAGHVRFRRGDDHPAVDLLFGGDEVVGGGRDEASFGGRGFERGGLVPGFHLQAVEPDESLFRVADAGIDVDFQRLGLGQLYRE